MVTFTHAPSSVARIVICAAIIIAGMISVASPASAGSNGQQIMLQVENGNYAAYRAIKNLRILGRNQTGQQTTYFAGETLINENPFHLAKWWWVGSTYIDGFIQRADGGSSYFYCSLDVPKSQTSNWTKVMLRPTKGSVGGVTYICTTSPG